MSESVISLDSEALDAQLTVLEDYVDELNTIASEVLSLTFGTGGGNESAGPCSGKSNEINSSLNEVCTSMADVIEKSVTHLKNIRDDITEADETQGGA